MEISILAFGIARDIVGESEFAFPVREDQTVTQLKEALIAAYPDFATLASFAIAVNGSYVADDHLLNRNDEVVIIPPVSGG